MERNKLVLRINEARSVELCYTGSASCTDEWLQDEHTHRASERVLDSLHLLIPE